METIFAVSSGAPPAAIAVLRVSGAAARAAVTALSGTLPEPRRARVRVLRDPANGMTLDRALVLFFPAPNSATGEDLVELHLHGGRAVVVAVERALAAQPSLRQAAPGEFTRRALASGRIDLAEAEGLGDLLMAETESHRRAAIASVEGAVGHAVDDWNARLLDLAARVEAMLDFADEDDVAAGNASVSVAPDAVLLAEEIDRALANPPVERLRDGLRVVLAGAPNAGKSTLLNALTERDAAIVSPISGTTRDRIEVPVVRDGIAYILIDTAGLAAATDDSIEAIGIDLARQAMASADIVLLLDESPVPAGPALIRVHPRADLAGRADPCSDRVAVSAVSGRGLGDLWSRIASAAQGLLPQLDRVVLNQRQRTLCAEAAAAIRAAASADDLLIVAECLRHARIALDRITGASDTEAMLDALFGRFCIGK